MEQVELLPAFIVMAFPALLATGLTIAVHRRLRHPLLFLVLSIVTFSWVRDAASTLLTIPGISQTPKSQGDLIAMETRHGIMADAVATVIGGFIVWRLADALKKT